MKYDQFRAAIESELRKEGQGLTWVELRDLCGLPYERACPTWTWRLELEIGLTRLPGSGRAQVWKLENRKARRR